MSNPDIIEIEFFPTQPKADLDDKDACALILSAKLVELFQENVAALKLGGFRTALSQLKNVYKRGAEAYDQKEPLAKNRGHFALARVNMFIRMLSEKSNFYKKINRLSVKTDQALLDIAGCFGPIEEDYVKASAEIEKYDLSYDFKNINELYLEEAGDSGFWFEV